MTTPVPPVPASPHNASRKIPPAQFSLKAACVPWLLHTYLYKNGISPFPPTPGACCPRHSQRRGTSPCAPLPPKTALRRRPGNYCPALKNLLLHSFLKLFCQNNLYREVLPRKMKWVICLWLFQTYNKERLIFCSLSVLWSLKIFQPVQRPTTLNCVTGL